MKSKYSIFLAALSITVLFSACGKIDGNNVDTSSASDSVTSQSSSTDNNDITEGNGEEEEWETETVEADISTESGYASSKRTVRVLGLKSYKKLDNGIYKDKAGKNKKYLVLFLEIVNNMIDDDYINANYLSAKVDGKDITNSVLFNEPEGYQTIFQHVGGEDTLSGFIVWEVPKDWKKIKIKYSGWKDTDNLNINCTFTPDDYMDPPRNTQ